MWVQPVGGGPQSGDEASTTCSDSLAQLLQPMGEFETLVVGPVHLDVTRSREMDSEWIGRLPPGEPLKYLPAYIPTYLHTYTRTHIHTYTHTYIHTYIHTHIHAYIHAYRLTSTGKPLKLLSIDALTEDGTHVRTYVCM